jgi:hypothetical protein
MKMPRGLLLLGLLCALGTGPASAVEPDWTPYAAVLAAHVAPAHRQGVKLNAVDYAALKADARFAAAVATVEAWPFEQLESDAERVAFLVNAYNLFALKMVVDHWPLASIKDIGSLLKPVWKRPAGTLDRKPVTLDDIEHRRLRRMGDPRIHMAIVCASISCPDLRPEPYTAATLDAQLDDQATQFLANPGKGLRQEGDTAHVSKIFDWFEDDFDVRGGVAAFIGHYHPLPAATGIDADLPYDWSVNGR